MATRADVTKMNEILSDRNDRNLTLLEQGAEILEFGSTEEHPFIALALMPEGHYRVVQAVAYLNRAKNLQLAIYLKEFNILEEAEELWLNAVTSITLFGDLFYASSGSGMRYVETLPTQNVIRIRC